MLLICIGIILYFYYSIIYRYCAYRLMNSATIEDNFQEESNNI